MTKRQAAAVNALIDAAQDIMEHLGVMGGPEPFPCNKHERTLQRAMEKAIDRANRVANPHLKNGGTNA